MIVTLRVYTEGGEEMAQKKQKAKKGKKAEPVVSGKKKKK